MRIHLVVLCRSLGTGLLLALVAMCGTAQGAQPETDAVRLTVTGPASVVFDSERDGCGKNDIPDLPLRAVRLADGSVIAIASQWRNRLFRGKSLDDLKRDCRIVYQGTEEEAPEKFDDRGWISSLWTQDGRTVYALVHNEYQAHRHPGRCTLTQRLPCWYNSVVLAKSTDAGRSFLRQTGAAALVAAPPFRQDVGQGKQRGFMRPTNIVKRGEYWYTYVFTPGYGEQRPGSCLIRSADIADPASWRAWDGNKFDIELGDPYGGGKSVENEPPCKSVGPFPRAIGSVSRVESSDEWIAVYTAGAATAETPEPGVYYSLSRDLTTWSAPTLLVALPMARRGTCISEPTYFYESLMDPDAKSNSFEDVGGKAYLFMTRSEVANCHQTMHRSLVRWPVKIETHLSDPPTTQDTGDAAPKP